MKKEKIILDACCGGKMFWFNKNHPRVLYTDKRRMKKQVIWQKGEKKIYFEVNPDKIADFRKLPFKNNTFKLVVFDPPHLIKV